MTKVRKKLTRAQKEAQGSTPAKDYKCVFCGKSYPSKFARKRHQ